MEQITNVPPIRFKKKKLHCLEKNKSFVKGIVKSLVMANKLQGFGGRKAQCRCNFICNIKKNWFTEIWFAQFLFVRMGVETNPQKLPFQGRNGSKVEQV